jgi:hypothetical protein
LPFGSRHPYRMSICVDEMLMIVFSAGAQDKPWFNSKLDMESRISLLINARSLEFGA